MGSSASKPQRGGAIHAKHKGPTEVVVERPPMEERAGKPVLNVPNSTYRILYIDPAQRQDVVARHGYIALRTDGFKEEEQEDLEAALPGQRRRRSTLQSDGGFDAFGARQRSDDGSAAEDVPKPTGGDDLSVNSGDEGDGAALARHATKRPGSGDAFGGTGVSRRSGTAGRPRTETMNRTAKHQQFLYPVGRYAQTKIFFEDRPGPGDFDEEHDGENEAVYEKEEDECFEIGGVPRIYPRPYEPTEADLTYELPSRVLDALRKAVDAPMEAFAIEGAGEEEAAALAEFKAQAMEKMALVRDPFEEDAREQELVVLAAPTIDHSLTAEEAEAKAKNKRRKKLHKQVNAWKDDFQAANGRKPTAEEMHGDPDFGPVYREYLALKKEFKASGGGGGGAELGDDPFASPDSKQPNTETDASPGSPQQATPQRLPPRLPPSGAAAPAAADPRTPQQQAMGPPATGPQATYNALPDSEKVQVKQMVRKIRAWKQEHMALHGIPATKADIVNDHHVSDDYMQLRRRFGTDELDVSSDEIAAKLEQEREEQRKREEEEAQAQAAAAAAAAAAEAAKPQLTLEEQYERRKELGKQLNEWKATFADANGRKPTATDIAADDRIQALYDEYVSLPKPPPTSDSRAASALAERSAEAVNADEKSAHKRKKQLGKELNAWKAKWADEHDGEPPTHADIEADPQISALYDEYKALQSALHSASRAEQSAVAETPGGADSSDEKSAHKRKKQLGKELNAWKAKWADEHDGEQPTHADIEADETIAPVYHEYKQLQAARRQSVSASRADSVEPHKRKKQLGKELNAWKAKFEAENGRKPTSGDIAENREIAAMYEEYQVLKSESKHGDSRSQSRMMDHSVDGRSPENAGNTDTEASEGPSSSKSAHKRKKQLGKELNAWKARFLEEKGTKPTVDDIMADDEIRPLFEEYQALKEEAATTTPQHSQGAGEDPAGASSEAVDSEAAHKRRKKLGKQLNEWKKSFKETQGRAPTQDDIAADPEVKAWFDEYSALPKERKDDDKGAKDDGADPDADIAAKEAAEEKARKKLLVHQLNQWKAAFAAENDRQPTTQDILGDQEIAPIYEEYLVISKRI